MSNLNGSGTLGGNLSETNTQPPPSGSANWGGIGGTLGDQTDLQNALNAKADASALTSHTGNTSNPHNTTASQVPVTPRGNIAATDVEAALYELDGDKLGIGSAGLDGDLLKFDAGGNAAPANSANVIAALGYTPENVANKNQANGYAGVDVTGFIPASILPSFVDDVLEFANVAAFPVTGETGKIYVALDNDNTYRWSGSVYREIAASPGSTDVVTEGSVNLYFTTARVLATVLAGLSAASGTFTDTDTLLTAFGKLKYLLDNISTIVRGTLLTGLSLVDDTVVAATDSVLVGIGKLQAQVTLRALKAGDTFTGLIQFSGTGHAGLQLNSLTTAQRNALTPVAGQVVFDSDLGCSCLYNGTHWEYTLHASLTQNETTTSNAVGSIPGLIVSVEADSSYEVTGYYLISCSSTGGVKFSQSTPAGCTMDVLYDGVTTGASTSVKPRSAASGSLTGSAHNTSAISSGVIIKGFLKTGANAGSLQMQFASGVNGQTSTVAATSYVRIEKIA